MTVASAGFVSGNLKLWAGQSDVAIEHSEIALRFDPRGHVSVPLATIGIAHFFSRRFDQAVLTLLLAIQDDPGFTVLHCCLAACYAHMKRLDDAREIVARLNSGTAAADPDASRFRNPEHRELYLSGLRLAMGRPEPP